MKRPYFLALIACFVTSAFAIGPITGSGGGSGDALTTNPLSQFASTTSLQLRGVLSDELGTGAALFDGATPTSFVLTNATGFPTRAVTAVFDGSGSALTTGNTGIPWTAPYSGTITGWNISVDTGTATFKVWKKADGTAIPTISDLINSNGVAISTGTHVRSSTVSDFMTTTVTAGDQFIIALTTVSGATKASFELEITK